MEKKGLSARPDRDGASGEVDRLNLPVEAMTLGAGSRFPKGETNRQKTEGYSGKN
jgi:hypothetical protein